MIALAALGATVGAVVLAGGCQKVLPPRNEPVTLIENHIPQEPDEATLRRDYDKSTLYYPNGTVVAGSTRFPLAPRDEAQQVERTVAEPVIFLANIVAAPISYFFKAPFDPYDWHGVITPASYTVQPAYPAEGEPNAAPDAGVDNVGGDNAAPTEGGPVPPADAPVPNISEPVRDPSGERPAAAPTENPAPAEAPGTPADANPQPAETPRGGSSGSTGGGTRGNRGSGMGGAAGMRR